MLLKPLQSHVANLVGKILAAEVVKIDDDNFTITKKSKLLDPSVLMYGKIEDHEVMFQTDYHIFNWWEVSQDSTQLNDREWKIGEYTMSFYTLQPS